MRRLHLAFLRNQSGAIQAKVTADAALIISG